MNHRQAFLKMIKDEPENEAHRFVYADWLDDQGECEEADRQRRWRASRDWLVEFAKQINYPEYQKDANGEYIEDEGGDMIETGKGVLGDPHTYEDVIEAGHDAVNGKVYCFGSDAGAEFFYGGGYTNSAEFFRHWSTVTGVPVPEAVIADPPFRCAC